MRNILLIYPYDPSRVLERTTNGDLRNSATKATALQTWHGRQRQSDPAWDCSLLTNTYISTSQVGTGLERSTTTVCALKDGVGVIRTHCLPLSFKVRESQVVCAAL